MLLNHAVCPQGSKETRSLSHISVSPLVVMVIILPSSLVSCPMHYYKGEKQSFINMKSHQKETGPNGYTLAPRTPRVNGQDFHTKTRGQSFKSYLNRKWTKTIKMLMHFNWHRIGLLSLCTLPKLPSQANVRRHIS